MLRHALIAERWRTDSDNITKKREFFERPYMPDNSADVPQAAIDVLQKFLEASIRKDLETMKTCVTKKTLEAGQMNTEGPTDVTIVLGQATREGENIIIPAKLVANPPSTDAPFEMPCIMMLEDGQWKFDLGSTIERLMSGAGLDRMMEEVASKMSTAMEGVADALSEGFKAAFGSEEPAKETQGEPDWEKASLEIAADELLPLPEMTPLPKTQAAISQALGSQVLIMAAIPDLLRTVHSDDSVTLINWFEDQLFAALPGIFAQAAQRVPVTGRLRAVRIEAAETADDRLIALDGSDLVYRMFLNRNEGYYSDDYIATILSGVVAGLPETIDRRVSGHRLLPNDQESPPLDDYRKNVIPRYMRRISELLSKNVLLEVNWEDPYDTTTATRQLSRWGLSRIHGAIALACQDEALREQLLDELEEIQIILGYNTGDRFANFETGTLRVGLSWYQGEKGCLYEYEIAQALTGQPVGTDPADNQNQADEEAQDTAPPPDAETQNVEHFNQAVASMREIEPMWRQQLEMVIGHPVELSPDFDALSGRYELVQPFVHQAITGALGAVTQLAFDPAVPADFKASLNRLIIRPAGEGQSCAVEFAAGEMTISVPLIAEGPAPTADIMRVIKEMW
jgi:hypothetical protein